MLPVPVDRTNASNGTATFLVVAIASDHQPPRVSARGRARVHGHRRRSFIIFDISDTIGSKMRRSATTLAHYCQRRVAGDRHRLRRHLSTLPQVDEIDCSNSSATTQDTTAATSTGWTLDREKRLRSILSGKAEVPPGLELAKETSLAALWHSAHGKIDDLSKLVKRAERFASKTTNTDSASVVPYEAAIRILIQSAESHPAHLIEADKMMKSLFDKARDGSRSVSFRTLNDLMGHIVTAWARVRLDSVRPLSGKTKVRSQINDRAHIVPADAAESWLRLWVHHVQMRNMHSSKAEEESLALGPGALVFGACIDAHAKSRRRGSAHRAEEILEWLIDLGRNAPADSNENWVPPRPNAVMFTSVVDAWARTAHNNQEAVRSAERWLATMEENYFEKGMMECKPSAIAYTSVIMAYSRRGGTRGSGRSHDYYNNNDPDMISDAEKAEDVLLRLMERNENFLDQTEVKDGSVDESIMPPSLVEIDVNVLNGLIDCWARQAGAATSQKESLAAANRAESWLAVLLHASMVGEGIDSVAQNVADDPVATRSILESHQKESTGTSGLLGSLPTLLAASMVSADVVSFNSTISAFSRVRNCQEAAERAERCFEAMKEQNIEPTSITFGAIVLAWGNTRSSEGAAKATLYLDEYEKMGRANKLKPHVIVYNNTLNAWASSGRKDTLPKMRIILDRMERSRTVGRDENSALVPSDIVSYHTFMKACTHEARENPGESFAYFLSAMDKLTGEDPAIVPESSTFLSVLLCIGQCVVSPKERCDERFLDMLKVIFDRCCKQGLVNQAFVGTLRSILPEGNRREEILADVMGVSVTEVSSADGDLYIRPEWRRNLQGKDRGGRGRTHGSATHSGAKHSEDLRRSSRQHIRR